MTNDDLMIFFKNSFILKFDIREIFKNVDKFPSKIYLILFSLMVNILYL